MTNSISEDKGDRAACSGVERWPRSVEADTGSLPRQPKAFIERKTGQCLFYEVYGEGRGDPPS